MSGAEAFAVLGAISAVISIVDGIKKVYEAASDKGGLPSAFRAVANRVPLVLETLQTAYDEVQAGNINDATCKAMQKVIEACGTKAKNLDTIIEEVLPEADASRMERYHKALKSLPKGSRVESLMKGILIDMQVLTSNHGMRVATKYETEKLVEAIKELEKLPPSAGNDLTDRGSQSATHNAGGNIYQAMASQYFAADTSRIYNAETMTFSDGNTSKINYNIEVLNLYTTPIQDQYTCTLDTGIETLAIDSLDSTSWYKIKNTAKPNMALDIINDGNQQQDGQLQMATEGIFSGQFWQFRPSKIKPGAYNLCTMWLGTNMCLDVYGNDKTRPHLAKAGNVSGQQWSIYRQGNGTWKLTNLYSKPLVLSADANGNGICLRAAENTATSQWILQRETLITQAGFDV